MNADRPFVCIDCKKAFKLKWHLKTHMKKCKGAAQMENLFACDKCAGKYASKKTLKFHQRTCKPINGYSCKECNKNFSTLQDHYEHKRKQHSYLQCEFCNVIIGNDYNMKRHINSKHNGLTPSRARKLEDLLKHTQSTTNEYKCDVCEKLYYDQSTLKRHKKLHQIPCQKCGHIFQCKQALQYHEKTHKDIRMKACSNVIVNLFNQNKNVSWAKDLVNIKEIPVTKLTFNCNTSQKIKLMFEEVERFMVLCKTRNQPLKISEIKEIYERNSKHNFEENIFRGLLSIIPEAYTLYLNKEEVEIIISGDVNPSNLFERHEHLENKLSDLEKENSPYIDLVELEKTKNINYKSAKMIISENIMKFSDDEEVMKVIDQNEKKVSSFYDKLKFKIETKKFLKMKRDMKMNNIDWQLLRLSRMARMTNNIFISEKREALKREILLEKIKFSGYISNNVGSDLDRLIQKSNGWLHVWKGWIKRNSTIDINNVCKLL